MDGVLHPSGSLNGQKWTFPAYDRIATRRQCDSVEQENTVMSSTSDKVSGKANELAGKAKQAVGDATDNRSIEAKGVAQEAKGDAQQAKGHAKEAVKNVVDKT